MNTSAAGNQDGLPACAQVGWGERLLGNRGIFYDGP